MAASTVSGIVNIGDVRGAGRGQQALHGYGYLHPAGGVGDVRVPDYAGIPTLGELQGRRCQFGSGGLLTGPGPLTSSSGGGGLAPSLLFFLA